MGRNRQRHTVDGPEVIERFLSCRLSRPELLRACGRPPSGRRRYRQPHFPAISSTRRGAQITATERSYNRLRSARPASFSTLAWLADSRGNDSFLNVTPQTHSSRLHLHHRYFSLGSPHAPLPSFGASSLCCAHLLRWLMPSSKSAWVRRLSRPIHYCRFREVLDRARLLRASKESSPPAR